MHDLLVQRGTPGTEGRLVQRVTLVQRGPTVQRGRPPVQRGTLVQRGAPWYRGGTPGTEGRLVQRVTPGAEGDAPPSGFSRARPPSQHAASGGVPVSLVTLPLGWRHPVQQTVRSETALLPSCFMQVAEFLRRIRCFCCFFIFVAVLYSM